MMKKDRIYRKARRRVAAKKGFFWHLMSYLIVIGFLFAMNILTDPLDIWFIYPALAWVVGLSFHYVAVFGIPGLNVLTQDWEERQLEKELNRLEAEEYIKNPHQPLAMPSPKEELLDLEPPENEMDQEIDMKEFKDLRKEWNDQEFV